MKSYREFGCSSCSTFNLFPHGFPMFFEVLVKSLYFLNSLFRCRGCCKNSPVDFFAGQLEVFACFFCYHNHSRMMYGVKIFAFDSQYSLIMPGFKGNGYFSTYYFEEFLS